jgi:hypothetical protein
MTSPSELPTTDPASIVLADGHTTVKEAFEVANEMHDRAEELANECADSDAGLMSKGAAIIEMLAAKLAEGRPAGGSCEKCGGSGRLTIYDTPTYVGQVCSPIGDEPCPKCSPDGNAT